MERAKSIVFRSALPLAAGKNYFNSLNSFNY